MSNYKIICNQTQLAVIRAGLEALARSYSGQWHIAMEDVFDHAEQRDPGSRLDIRLHLAELGNRFLKTHSFAKGRGRNGSIAWDMQTAIRQLLAFTHTPKGGMGVCFDDPHHESDQPPIEVRPTDEMADPRPARVRFAREIEEALGTTDLTEAVARVRMWKSAYDRLTEQPEES
jgi:hypothetical protein